MNLHVIKKIKSAPINPGVYLFYKNNQPLYIGKAANLKSRLNNYLKPTDMKTSILSKEANRLKLIKCESPIAALIEESKQIKRLQPKLNVYWRDDKSYHYVCFTNESFSKVFITHRSPRHSHENGNLDPRWSLPSSGIGGGNDNYIGPFTDGSALKLILRIIRRRYLYCTCRESHFRQCLNSQIRLCLGFCCVKNDQDCHSRENGNPDLRWSLPLSGIGGGDDRKGRNDKGRGDDEKEYQKNIKIIKSLLSGGNKKLLEKITTTSDRWAAENIFSHSQYLVEPQPGIFSKIECYDVSNLSGKEAVGAMTVLVNNNGKWEADKNQFRKFKIKTPATRDDPKMITEIVGRRLRHTEWPFPDLIIVDGGKTQYNAVKKITGNLKVIGFAKPNRQIIGMVDNLPAKQIIEKAIRQTHKFAINYHRKLRKKLLN